jgi:hypothetical protein
MPFVHANSNSGGFLVVWRDVRNRPASTDIFGQFVDIEIQIPGDVDGDGDVDLSDLGALLASYGLCEGHPRYNPDADFTGDNCVGLSDLATLLANYGYGT